jgi:hypothetical protein
MIISSVGFPRSGDVVDGRADVFSGKFRQAPSGQLDPQQGKVKLEEADFVGDGTG